MTVGYGFRPGEGYSLWELAMWMAAGRARDDVRRAGNQPARIRGV